VPKENSTNYHVKDAAYFLCAISLERRGRKLLQQLVRETRQKIQLVLVFMRQGQRTSTKEENGMLTSFHSQIFCSFFFFFFLFLSFSSKQTVKIVPDVLADASHVFSRREHKVDSGDLCKAAARGMLCEAGRQREIGLKKRCRRRIFVAFESFCCTPGMGWRSAVRE
jgi:hypothetical protein